MIACVIRPLCGVLALALFAQGCTTFTVRSLESKDAGLLGGLEDDDIPVAIRVETDSAAVKLRPFRSLVAGPAEGRWIAIHDAGWWSRFKPTREIPLSTVRRIELLSPMIITTTLREHPLIDTYNTRTWLELAGGRVVALKTCPRSVATGDTLTVPPADIVSYSVAQAGQMFSAKTTITASLIFLGGAVLWLTTIVILATTRNGSGH